MMTLPHRHGPAVLALVVLALGIGGLFVGELAIDPHGLFAPEGGVGRTILVDIRAPRMVAAALVGAALGMAGAAMQGLLRNPLAEPGVLGVSAGATLGGTAMLYGLPGMTVASAGAGWVALGAVAGALLVTALLATAAMRIASVEGLVLTGIGVSSLLGAVMALALNFAPNPFSLSDLVNWTLGSVANRSWNDVAFAAPPIIAGMGIITLVRHRLALFAFGDEAASALGADLMTTRVMVIAGVGLAVGGAVALAGAVGFVGLVAPHLVRPMTGHDPARLWPAAVAGAGMLLAADLLIRLVPVRGELKLGVIAALVGAPVFLAIAMRRGTGR